MNRLVRVTLAPVAEDADGISLVQAVGGAGNLTITGAFAAGGIATLDMARRIAVTSAGNDAARTLTITGTDRYGNVQTETLAAANAGVVYSLKDYKTVTQIAIDGAAAGNISAGTNQRVSTQWFPVDRLKTFNLGISVEVGAVAPTYSIEYTLDDPFTPGVGVNPDTDFYLKPYPLTALEAKNTSLSAAITTPITAVRLTLTAFAATASATATFAPGPVEGR